MRVAVIVVWRPKGTPGWDGRESEAGRELPDALAFDRTTPPYTGTHLASLLPRRWDIELVHEAVRDVDTGLDVDAAFISTMDYCAPRARRLARAFRARGVKVIMGGLYPTMNPAYFSAVSDSIVVGEAEPVIGRVVADLERAALEPIYEERGVADLAELPVPRYDLVETDFHVPMSYEVTRGCPFTCSFCILSALQTPYRRRPIANVVRDIQAVPESWTWKQRKLATFWDNNLGADRRYFLDLCEALVPVKKYWGTQTSIDTITRESARLMGKSGCRIAYIGLESLSQQSLDAANKRHNNVAKFKQRISWLHDNGVLVMSIFLLGLDGDTLEYLERLPDLVDEIGVDIPVFSLAAPLEGTPFRAELERVGRLLPGDLNYAMDGSHLVYRPSHVEPEALELALYAAQRRAYSWRRMAVRVARRATAGLSTMIIAGGANLNYTGYQRAIARRGVARVRQRGSWPGGQVELGFVD